MRIAMISEHASPLATLGGEDAGGQNVYVDELARALARRGHRVDVFTRRDRPDLPSVVDWAPGVRVVNLAAGPPAFVKKDLLVPYLPALRDALLRFAARQRQPYDLLHAHFWMSGWVACEVRERLGLPIVVTFHALGAVKRHYQGTADTSPDDRLSVEQRILDEAEAVLATCPAEREDLERFYRPRPERVTVVPCGVNLARFRPLPHRAARAVLGIDPEEPLLLCVSRMVPRKGIEDVVRALALLRRAGRSARLLVVGGDWPGERPVDNLEARRLARVASSLGVRDAVTFVGQKRPDELPTYYAAADVFVSTPWYEPFGMTPLEAMACGCAVVVSDVGGLRSSVQHGRTGLRVPPRHPPALAEALERLLADAALRRRLGRAGLRRARRHFDWDRIAAQVEAVYRGLPAVVAGDRRPAAARAR